MADPAGAFIPGYGPPKTPKQIEEDRQAQLSDLDFKYQEQKRLADIEREKAARFERELAAGPQLTFNPIETTTDAEGKKSYSLIKELQLEGPEKFVQAERERLRGQQMLGLDDLQKQRSQIEAQQAGALAKFGLRGGNRALMGRYSMRDALMARQGLGRQFQTQAGELESKGQQMAQDIRQKNVGLMGQAMKDIETFNLDKWKQQKAVEAARIQAQATRDAAKPDK
jgi:hypothetical protein